MKHKSPRGVSPTKEVCDICVICDLRWVLHGSSMMLAVFARDMMPASNVINHLYGDHVERTLPRSFPFQIPHFPVKGVHAQGRVERELSRVAY